jgi:Radical SAM superfamily
MKHTENYQGVELGPIRPPSEARSLLLRLTRNCPWNRCTFCGLYKGEKFSIRPVGHLIQDIDTIHRYVDEIQSIKAQYGGDAHRQLLALHVDRSPSEKRAFHAARNWIRGNMQSVFLQDANSLIMKTDHLVEILTYIKKSFPQVTRITSYARSHTIARKSDSEMARLAEAGLNRIHIGMESASDAILTFVKKGVDKKGHILAGQKVKRAGIELSEYFMPGLGGQQFSRENGLETAAAMNEINPDFIRIRTLALPESLELYKDCQAGTFIKLGDVAVAQELLLFFENLQGINSMVKSDHALNLFQEAEGRLPEALDRITTPLQKFLTMTPEEQMIYMVGKRTAVFSKLDDMNNLQLLAQAKNVVAEHQLTPDNVEAFCAEVITRFI